MANTKQEKSSINLEFYSNNIYYLPQVSYYEKFLANQEIILIHYLNEAEKKALKERLLYAAKLIHHQYCLNRELRLGDIDSLKNSLQRCKLLLQELHANPLKNQVDKTESAAEESPIPMAACTSLRHLFNDFLSLGDPLIALISKLNEIRLFWLWGDGLFRAFTDIINAHFSIGTATLEVATNHLALLGGYASWVFYLVRFVINTILIFCPPKLEDNYTDIQINENDIEVFEVVGDDAPKLATHSKIYARTKWRFLSLANDGPWGPANWLTFAILIGTGTTLGWVGCLVNGALFFYDIVVCLARWARAEYVFYKQLRYYQEQLNNPYLEEWKRADFEKILGQLDNDRSSMRVMMLKELLYAAGFFVGSALALGLFMPPGFFLASTLVLFAYIGAVIGLALTLIYYTSTNVLAIRDSWKEINAINNQVTKLTSYKEELSEVELKVKYINYQQLALQSRYHFKCIEYQLVKLAFTVVLLTVVPAIIFTIFLFAPLSLGVGLMALTLVITLLSYAVLKACEPVLQRLPDLTDLKKTSFESIKIDSETSIQAFLNEHINGISNDKNSGGKANLKLNYFKNKFFKNANIYNEDRAAPQPD